MSSIFSDPFFRRGSTLLSGEPIELNAAGAPVAGNEVVGQVKAFQDVNPTGRGDRYSNRLVYCIAARYIGADTDGATLAKRVVYFSPDGPLTTIGTTNGAVTTAYATASLANAGVTIGVVDEYLSPATVIRKNDVVWVVVKGPTTALKNSLGATVCTYAYIEASGGVLTTAADTDESAGPVGEYLATAGTSDTSVRVNLHSNRI